MSNINQYFILYPLNPYGGLYYKNKHISLCIKQIWYKDIRTKDSIHYWEPKKHPLWSLRMILEGESTLGLEDGRILLLKAGDFVLFPEFAGHYTSTETVPTTKCGMLFTLNVSKNANNTIYAALNTIEEHIQVHRFSSNAARLWEQIIQLQEKPGIDFDTSLMFLAMSILMDVFNSIVEDIDQVNPKYEARVNKAQRFIQSTVSAVTSTETVASAVGLSIRQLSRLFVEHTGSTLGDYIAETRKRKICELLQDQQLSIAEIAHRMDYHDVASFSRAFKRAAGVTPNQYRKSLQLEKSQDIL